MLTVRICYILFMRASSETKNITFNLQHNFKLKEKTVTYMQCIFGVAKTDYYAVYSLKKNTETHLNGSNHLHIYFVSLIEDELEPFYWNNKGRNAIHAALNKPRNSHQAKNAILFLGDGKSKKDIFLPFMKFL